MMNHSYVHNALLNIEGYQDQFKPQKRKCIELAITFT